MLMVFFILASYYAHNIVEILGHLSKRYKTVADFLVKTYHFFNSLFLFLSILDILMFSLICLFCQLGHFD